MKLTRGRQFAFHALLAGAGILASSTPCAQAAVWFIRARADGDGRSEASPIGSTAALERMTKPGDVIVLLPGEAPIDGGLSLKQGQTLVGIAAQGSKPSITNSDPERNGGNGLVLGNDCRLLDVRIENTKASAVLGVDVTGTFLIGVDVDGSNRSSGLTEFEVGLIGKVCHGGVLFISAQPAKQIENRILRLRVTNAAGIGIGAIALRGGKNRLTIDGTRAEGGAPIPPLLDMGVAVVADGEGSRSSLEMTDSTVSRRMSAEGRNLIAFASAGGKATARIERSTSGESGQDGIIGVASMVPAAVEIVIRDSTIEKASQVNLEGTILNLPPYDPMRAHEGSVSIYVERCVIRDAGFVEGFRGQEQNIWLAPSVIAKGPFARGQYRRTVRDSVVEKARTGGITVGNAGSDFKLAPDQGEYEVILSGNTIRENGGAELEIAAAKARVDARKNFWGDARGLADARVRLRDEVKASQLDKSDPLDRPRGD